MPQTSPPERPRPSRVAGGAAGPCPSPGRPRRVAAALLALLVLPLLAVGCAGPAAAPSEPPLPYPASARERILRIALAEWEDWGRVTRDAFVRAPSTGLEGEPENFPRVLAYWGAVEYDHDAVATNRALYASELAAPRDGPRSLFAKPYWSAAFVAYVMRSAGVGLREFRPSATHAFYLDRLIADAMAYPDLAPFVPRDAAEYAPRPGDLVCFDRSPRDKALRHWSQRVAEAGVRRPMHCDIVTGAAPGVVEVVGGNVMDAVAMTRIPADAAGRLLPPPPGFPPWFGVFENRLGRLPPWADAPPSPPTPPTPSQFRSLPIS